MDNKKILSAILLGMTGGNAIVDAVNNYKSSEKELNKKTSSNDNLLKSLNKENIGRFIDAVTLVTVFVPQLRAMGFLLNTVVAAYDGYVYANDYKNNSEYLYIDREKFFIDLAHVVTDRVEAFKPSTVIGKILLTGALILDNREMYLLNKESENDRITEITIYVPADNLLFAPGEYTIKIPTKYLEDQGIGNNGNNPTGNSDNNPQLPGDPKNPKDQPKTPNSNPNNGDSNGNGSRDGGNEGIYFDPPLLKKLKDLLDRLRKAIDPVVLNLSEESKANGLGASYSYFDYDGDGFAERTAWIGEQQGLLVVDLNENGIIDDGKELFGDKTILKNGCQAKDGYQALKDVDDNKDGVIDSQDSAWLKLRVWVDNGDGMTQEGELKTLEELGIESIKLNGERIGTSEEEGNILEKNRILYKSRRNNR